MSHKMRMDRKKLKVVSLVSAPFLIGLGVFIADPAFAAQGKQIQICQPQSDFKTIIIQGTNGDGDQDSAEMNNVSPDCTTAPKTWTGNVNISWSDSPETGPQGTDCNIDPNTSENPVPCFGPRVDTSNPTGL